MIPENQQPKDLFFFSSHTDSKHPTISEDTKNSVSAKEAAVKVDCLQLALHGTKSALWDISINPANPLDFKDKEILSPRHKEFIGYAEDEFPGTLEAWQERVHPEDRNSLLDCWLHHYHDRTEFMECEYRVRHRDGSFRWILSRGKILWNEQGIPTRWIGIDWDISEHKKDELELKRLASIMSSSYDAILSKTLDGIITGWNNGAERIYGYKADEILGKPISWLIPEERRGEENKILEKVKHGEPVEQLETVRVRKDGQRIFVSITVSPIRDSGGTVVAATIIARDVTDQKQAAESLRRSEGLLRAVVETAVDGIITIDERGMIQTANPAVERIFGYTVSEIRGRNVSMLMPNPYRSEHNQYLDNYLKTGNPKIIGHGREVEGLRKDGSVFPLELAVSETQIGTTRIFTGIVRDISARKKAEQDLKSLNENLELRVRERTRSLIHYQKQLQELATELTLTEQRERRRLANDLHDYLAQLLVSSKLNLARVRNMVQSIGVIEIVEEVDQSLNQALYYTRTLIAELSPSVLYESGFVPAIHWLARQMDKHGLRVQVVQEGDPFELSEDKALLVFQASRELLMNVVKHAHVDEATVTIQYDPTHQLILTVQDEGRGLHPPTHEEPSPLSGKYGLFNIQERLKAIGGHFEIFSASGKGTISKIVLPLNSDTGEPKEDHSLDIIPSLETPGAD